MITGESLTGSDKVRKLQTVLHAKAKEEPGLRFHALIDKVWRADFLMEAWAQVSPAYNAVNRHTGKRLRQWLGRKHKTRAGRFVRYSEERLCADYSLLRLTRQTVAFPSAKA